MFTSKKLSTILALSMLMSFAPSLCGLSNDTKKDLKRGAFAVAGTSLLFSLFDALDDRDDDKKGDKEERKTLFETKKGRITLACAFVVGCLISTLEKD